MNSRSLNTFALLSAVCLSAASLDAQTPAPPAISGVDGIRLLAADLEKSRNFYGKQLGLAECHTDAAACFRVNLSQKIELDPLGRETSPNRLVFVAFNVRDVATLRQQMKGKGLQLGDQSTRADGTKFFDMLDPEKHVLQFVEHVGPLLATKDERWGEVSRKIIHLGYVVQNRTAMDHLYKEILGFRVYWQGGMKDADTDWVDMQVPGGTDWLEYMLNVSRDANHKTLGVMNHIALGVDDIHAAEKQLRANGWSGSEKPQLGRDGKWQLNLYDPDDTRVEFMEFKPTKEPCCSPYTGPHPVSPR